MLRNLLNRLPKIRSECEILRMSTVKKGKKKHVTVEYDDSAKEQESSESKKPKFLPNHWEQTLEHIRVMRGKHDAPVDTMGCEKCADIEADEKTQRFQILVALMLSSQTKDAVTFAACQKLHKNGFSPAKLAKMDPTELEKLLIPVGFYKTKAKSIIKASQIILDEHQGDIPDSLQGLVKLPGVGPKMAHICMKSAWNQNTGIGVDVHVHRIANRLHWVAKPTTDPEKTRVALEDWLPKELWQEINLMMVGFGQTICLPKSPKCSECLNQKICPSAFKESPTKAKSRKS